MIQKPARLEPKEGIYARVAQLVEHMTWVDDVMVTCYSPKVVIKVQILIDLLNHGVESSSLSTGIANIHRMLAGGVAGDLRWFGSTPELSAALMYIGLTVLSEYSAAW